MEREEQILDIVKLKNGLSVHFIDRSRPIAGDRWQVRLLIRVPLEPQEEHFAKFPDPSEARADFISLCPRAEFEIEKVRNFVDQDQLGTVLQKLKDDFSNPGLQYLENPGFAQRWVIKKYEELKCERAAGEAQKQAWQ